MQDNQLIQIFRPLIVPALIAQGFTGVAVKESYQPTQQGVNTSPTVYFFKTGDRRYGFLKRSDSVDLLSSGMIHTELQTYETTFQVSALVIQNPKIISYTAADLVNAVAGILQSDNFLQILFNSDVQVLRITDIINPYFLDDMDRYEAGPFFKITFIHKQIVDTAIPAMQTTKSGIFPI